MSDLKKQIEIKTEWQLLFIKSYHSGGFIIGIDDPWADGDTIDDPIGQSVMMCISKEQLKELAEHIATITEE